MLYLYPWAADFGGNKHVMGGIERSYLADQNMGSNPTMVR